MQHAWRAALVYAGVHIGGANAGGYLQNSRVIHQFPASSRMLLCTTSECQLVYYARQKALVLAMLGCSRCLEKVP